MVLKNESSASQRLCERKKTPIIFSRTLASVQAQGQKAINKNSRQKKLTCPIFVSEPVFLALSVTVHGEQGSGCLTPGRTRRYRPYGVRNHCRGEPACSPWYIKKPTPDLYPFTFLPGATYLFSHASYLF